MAHGILTGFRAWPAWARVAAIYLAARIATTAMLILAASLAGPGSRHGAHATPLDLMMGWDAQWYWLIAVEGYPAELPRDETGLVATNQWAFMPLYPMLARLLSSFSGDYRVTAVAVSVVAGYLASLVLHRLLRRRVDDAAATWAVAFFAAGPLAALFQMGYAEALFLLWLFLALDVLVRRRFAWLYLLIPLMGFTRPGVLAFSLLLALYGIQRWRDRRRDPLPVGHVVHIVATGLWAAVVGFSWQVLAGVVTGDAEAYLETELSWRRTWLDGDDGGFVPFEGFVQAAGIWFPYWGVPVWFGLVALVVLVASFAALLLFDPHVRRLGIEIRLWSASYVLYLLAVFFPQSSIFRLLLPLAPLAGALALVPARPWRIGVLVAGLAGQWLWIHQMLVLGNAFYQVP
ncbi:hypothetical protein [Microbacterium sp. No. 7]|uniref:hypothetical protein n=1 Tax=Microbacterium sp. No. 7 TaxID=1714373 RepID=UPI0006CFF816|nr:hypothetical protein [Microbacterium sp. No. 7]ALJ19940.1 hypothetical protein AOA12_08475 [Microbacterium sp. No. 7]